MRECVVGERVSAAVLYGDKFVLRLGVLATRTVYSIARITACPFYPLRNARDRAKIGGRLAVMPLTPSSCWQSSPLPNDGAGFTIPLPFPHQSACLPK